MRTLRPFATLVIVFGWLSGACIPLSLPRRGLGGGNAPAEFAAKLVVGKEPPTELIAEDGTRCITSRDRFERARIGFEMWCVWTDGAAGDPLRATFRR